MGSEVLVEIDGGVVLITINRPEVKNAVNTPVARGIAAAVDELDNRDDLRVAVLTGAGDTFCAGMDIKAYIDGDSPVLEGRGFAGLVEKPPAKPLIAAVEGFVLAGGFELALACDLIVAGESARFGIPEVKRGLAAGAGGLVRLPQQIPPRIAIEMAVTGDFISARRASELGLINQVVEDGCALQSALDLAKKISANAPLAVAASKRVILESRDWNSAEFFTRQREILKPIYDSEDAKEGAKAFAEKRSPSWQGS